MVTSNTFAIRKATATQRLETMTETEKDLEYKAFRKRLANDEPLTQSDVDRLDPMGERCSGERSPTCVVFQFVALARSSTRIFSKPSLKDEGSLH